MKIEKIKRLRFQQVHKPIAMCGSPVGGNPLCPPFKNRPNRQINHLWIESTRATIGKYEHFFIQVRALTTFLFPVCLLHHEGHDYYAHLINLQPVLILCQFNYLHQFHQCNIWQNAVPGKKEKKKPCIFR